MKTSYLVIMSFLCLVGILVFYWFKHLSSIDLRFDSIGDSYMGITVGETKAKSIDTVLSGELSTKVSRTRCLNFQFDGQSEAEGAKVAWIKSTGDQAMIELVDCDRVMFFLSSKRPDYLSLDFDGNNNLVRIERFRYWSEGP